MKRLRLTPPALHTWIEALPFTLRLVPILLLAWLLALWRLGASDLWLDEAISHWISDRPLLDMLRYTMQQSREHPPLYYAVLHVWMQMVGQSEFALRSLSALGGLAGVALVATLARRWFSDRIALLTALLLATSPLWVLHARDARMYSWLVALALLNVYALDRGLFQRRWRDWALFFGSLLLMLGTHYFSGLLLVSYTVYLVLRWRRLPRAGRMRLALLLGGLAALGGEWIISQPGPRGSLLETAAFALRAERSLSRLAGLFAQWALGSAAFSLPAGLIWLLALPVWLLALIGIVAARRSRWGNTGLPWLLALLIPFPIVLAFSILPAIQARHVMATYGLFALAVALGIARLGQHRRWLGAVALVAVLSLNLALGLRQITLAERPFSAPLRYVGERARADEPVAYTYFFDWPQDNYYNTRRLPANFLLVTDEAITDQEAETKVAAALADKTSLWLMLYPGLDNTDRLELAFNKLAFPTPRVWFPGDRGAVHFFSPRPLQERATAMTWDNGIALARWWISGDAAAAGDALRLQFEWGSAEALAEEALLALRLVGTDRAIWAEQVWAPCNGRCPVTDWPGGPVADRLAFYLPPDLPPGAYELHIGWISPAGAASLGLLASETVKQADLPLSPVTVTPPAQAANIAAAPPLRQALAEPLRAGLILNSVDFDEPTVRSGAALAVPMQLTVSAPQPELEAQLVLEGSGQQHRLNAALAPTWHPASAWTPGRAIRVQPQFQMPGAIRPGRYRVSLGVLTPGAGAAARLIRIGALRVEDRPRRFDVPEVGVVADVTCDEGIRLARFALQDAAAPGSQVPLTLIWQAGGPASRNWKIFAHLVDAGGVVRSQADAYPQAGLALTPSWRAGEVIVDEHRFALPTDLPAGSYRVRLGFYDEATGERLRCGDGDSITLPVTLEVSAP